VISNDGEGVIEKLQTNKHIVDDFLKNNENAFEYNEIVLKFFSKTYEIDQLWTPIRFRDVMENLKDLLNTPFVIEI